MKPIKLIIDGVNSFSSKQEIDFGTLSEKGIFGIFGKTGSGKSTILDCIFLALYGKIIRTKKPSEFINLGKNSAYVSLTFSSSAGKKPQVFEAVREFKINRDNNKIESGAKLFEILQDGSKTVIAKTEEETNKKCAGIVGFGAEEFKRCIALPQGEYSKLLKDSGYDKIQILSKVFNLERYGENLFNDLVKQAEAEEKRLAYLDGAINEIDGTDTNELDFNTKELERTEIERDAIATKTSLCRKTLLEKEKENIVAGECAIYEFKLKELIEKKPEITRKQKKLNIMKLSHKIAPTLEFYESINAEFEVIEKKLKTTDEELIENANALAKITEGGEQDRTKNMLRLAQIEVRKKALNLAITSNQKAKQLSSRIANLEEQQTTAKQQLEEKLQQNEKVVKELKDISNNVQTAQLQLAAVAGAGKQSSTEALKNRQILDVFQKSNLTKQEKLAAENEQLKNEITLLTGDIEKLKQQLADARRDISENYGENISHEESLARCTQDYIEIKNNAKVYLIEKAKLKNNERQIAEFSGAILEAEAELNNYTQMVEELRRNYEDLKTKHQKAISAREKHFGQNIIEFLKSEQNAGSECPVCSSVVSSKPVSAGQVSLSRFDFEIENISHRITEILADKEEFIGREHQTKQNILFIKAEIKRLKEENIKIQNLLILTEKEHNEFVNASEEKIHKLIELSRVAAESLKSLIATCREVEALTEEKTKTLVKKQLQLDINSEALLSLAKELEFTNAVIAENDVVITDAKNNELDIKTQEFDLGELSQAFFKKLEEKEEASEKYLSAFSTVNSITQQIENLKQELAECENKVQAARKENLSFADELRNLNAEETQINNHLNSLVQNETALLRQETKLKAQKAALLSSHAFKQSELKQIEDEFNSMLQLGGVSKEEIISSVEIEDISKLEEDIARFEKEFASVQSSFNRANEILNTLPHKNKTAEQIRDELTVLENEHIEIIRKIEWLGQKISHAQKLKEKSKYLIIQKNEASSRIKDIRELQNAISGGKLLKFVAEEYLINIAQKANDMLALLTSGRYQFVYDDDFKICDNLSGGSVRSINTLSGGETFLASLSLAIAITEFTTLFKNRAFEFMFLDEGFGTLDKESLEMVMLALRRLQSENFAIGIISHEEVVKNKIPRKIEIEKPNSFNGSIVKMVL